MFLSIIIPVYNNFKNLSRCLKSLEKQTVFELWPGQVEVIVVDDGSKESANTLLFCHPHESEDPKVPQDSRWSLPSTLIGGGNDNKSGAVMTIKKYRIAHSGASAARNFGFLKSSGQYVFFCDSDVIFLKSNALEKMIKMLEENPDKTYSYSSFKYGLKTFKCGEFDAEKLKQNNYISTMSMIRRSALMKITNEKNQPFDESLKRFQDWDLWLTLLEKGENGVWLSEILWQAKIGGSMSKWLPKIFYKLPFLKKVKDFEKAKEIIKVKHSLKF